MVFIKLSELGSLTRASLALEITNSTISRQLAQLETQCGGKQFRCSAKSARRFMRTFSSAW
ncbi:LysR family transcriptional regulator [Pseudomonas sp. B21128]|uniref:LysR family transcriptional regulator n=1 Tax=unclassified Pseudomonas TaxID=196821 RepID=UPI0037841B78